MAPYEAVISGIGGAFPESHGLDDFIDNLMSGKNVATVDDRRWKPGMLGTSPYLGKIGNVHHFDNNLFRVHKPLARLMDPLARLMLERSLEAVIDSGMPIQALQNTTSMVSMTATVSESESRTCSIAHDKKAAGYGIMAASKTMMSNRISYFLNLKGPSITLDGDWTVAMVALRRAAKAIETGECEYALIGAANTCIFPELNKIYESLGFLSSDGKSRALDAHGTGCFRSEGAVVFLIQRADTARRVYAHIAGIDETCVGKRSRFVAVSTSSLPPLVQNLYTKANADPSRIEFLGTDGNAIPEIESKELDATAAVLCRDGRKKPLPISSSKSAIGNTDAVTALAAIIHAIAVMERGCIPPVLNFQEPTPSTAIRDGRLEVVTERQELRLDADSLLSVNTLGWSGGISHAILRPNRRVKTTQFDATKDLPRLVIVSGRTEEDSVEVALKIAQRPFDAEFIRLTQESFSSPIPGYGNRACTVIPSTIPELPPIVNTQEYNKIDRPVWLVYSGMGSQWAGMGKGLLQIPIFAETIQRLQPLLEPEGIDLMHTITTEDSSLFENIIYSFISIAAIQIGLTNILRSLGIEVAGILGHSTGELGCAYGDNCLTEEETLLAAYARGKASLSAKLIPGMMAAIGMGWQEASAAVPASIDVACHNSSDNCSISGPVEDVKAFVEELAAKNIFARMVNVSNIAFHSRYVQPAGPVLKELLQDVIRTPRRRSERWVASSLNPGDEHLESSFYGGVEYFINNLLSPVRFQEAFRSVPPNAIVVELAPHGLLQPLIRRDLPDGAVSLALTKRGHPDGLRFLLENVGKLFLEGVSIKPWVLAPEVPLPVARGTPSLGCLASLDHREEWPLIVNSRMQVSRPMQLKLYAETTPKIYHQGRQYCSPSILLELVWKELADQVPLSDFPVKFEMLEFSNTAEVRLNETCEIEIQIQKETGLFEVALFTDQWNDTICLLKGKIHEADSTDMVGMMSSSPREDNGVSLNKEDVYAELQDHDLNYDENLKALRRVTVSEKETTGISHWSGQWHILLDSLFQLAELTSNTGPKLKSRIRAITIAPEEIRAASNALPVRHDRVQHALIAPGLNITGYRDVDITKDGSVTPFQMGCGPLGTATNLLSNDFLKSVAIHLTQNTVKLGSAINVVLVDSQCISTSVQLHVALRSVLVEGAQTKVSLLCKEGESLLGLKGVVVFVLNSRTPPARIEQVIKQQEPHLAVYVVVVGSTQNKPGLVTIAANRSPCGETLSLLLKEKVLASTTIEAIHLKTGDVIPEVVNSDKQVALVWRGRPREGVFGALATIRSKSYSDRASMVVILDDKAPAFSLTEKLYLNQLSLRLAVNVLVDGRWNTLQFTKYRATPSVPPRVNGIDVACLGLNPVDLADNAEPAVGVVDYSGTWAGNRVMGIACRRADWGASPDEVLSWSVPHNWSDQDAASVPVVYAMAYHSIIVLGRLTKETEKLFIMNGASPFGQACVRVALAVTHNVVVSVTSEEQKRMLLALFPQIKPEHVLRSDMGSFGYGLGKLCKREHGRVVNAFDVALVIGSAETVELVGRMTNSESRLVILSKTGFLKQKVGMEYFAKSAAMIAGGAEAVLSATKRDKEAVWAALLRGIQTGVVVPLATEVVQDADNLDLQDLRRTSKQVVWMSDLREARESKKSEAAYAIAGGHANSMVTVARAASSKGAKFALATNRDCGAPLRARFVPSLKRTSFVPYPTTPADVTNFVAHTSKIENLKAIVINVEDTTDRKLLSLLNNAIPSANGVLRDVRVLVLTESLSHGTETVENLRQTGLQACAVVGERQQSSKLLPTLLSVKKLPEVVFTCRNGADCGVVFGVPNRRRSLRPDAQEQPDRRGTAFIEMTSLSPRLRLLKVKEDPLPLFMVAGKLLPTDSVAEISRNILSPVLMVPSQNNLTAETLTQQILRVQPRGPWALFGDAVASPLLLRTANLIEAQAGRPEWREVVALGLLENADHVVGSKSLQHQHAGSLHLVSYYEESGIKSAMLTATKTKHFVVEPKHIATVINDSLLSPLTKIVAC